MPLLNWLLGRRPSAAPSASKPKAPAAAGARPNTAGLDPAAVRKVERAERRERIYSVVREAMLQAGILSGSYKFKVLALDERGRRFLVMIDLSRALAGDTLQLLRVEEQVAQAAKARFDLEVNGIYWRTNNLLTGGVARPAASPVVAAASTAATASTAAASTPANAPASKLANAPTNAPATPPTEVSSSAARAARSSGRFDPIEADEIAAFKLALSQANSAPAAPSGTVQRSGARARPADFADTHTVGTEERPDALGHTQYGEPH